MSSRKLSLSLFLILILLSCRIYAQEQKKPLINWYTLEEAEKLQEKAPRIILIDMYTDWCGWCKVMDTTTFLHPDIAAYINTFFYPVKFNAERKDTVTFRGKSYINTGEGRRPPHQLAVELLKGKMSYPTLVYMDESFTPNPISGYMPPEKIEPVLIYFAERINKTAPFEIFSEHFTKIFREKVNYPDSVDWISFPEVFHLNQTSPRKTMINIYSKYNRGSEVMTKSTLNHPVISAYLNKYFYCVDLMVERTDTIRLGDQIFINEMKTPNYPHQLPIALLQGQMYYPTTLFLDEKLGMINKVNGYVIPKDYEAILKYIGNDAFKNSDWEEFRKDFKGEISEKENP
jgi:thioredoxin-related protein